MTEVDANQLERPRQMRFLWMVLATLALLASAGALMLWMPYHQRKAVIAEIESRGGRVGVRPNAPLWLEQYIDANRLRIFDEVMSIDLMDAGFNDDDMDLLLELPETQGLAMLAPSLTDAGVLKLKDMKNLGSVMLVNCPHVSVKALNELKKQRPGLQIIRRGEAFLGIAGITAPSGCMVQQVLPGSAADKAGLRVGDVISAFENKPTSTYEELTDLLNEKHSGQTVRLKLTRVGESEPLEVEATLGSWEMRKTKR